MHYYTLAGHPLEVPLLVGASASHVMHVPWTHPTQHSNLRLGRFSHFHTADGGEFLYFTVCVNKIMH